MSNLSEKPFLLLAHKNIDSKYEERGTSVGLALTDPYLTASKKWYILFKITLRKYRTHSSQSLQFIAKENWCTQGPDSATNNKYLRWQSQRILAFFF